MIFGIKDVIDSIKDEGVTFETEFGKKKKEDKKNDHNLKHLITHGWKELKRDVNYSVVFLISSTDKITMIALGTFNNLIL